MRDARLADESDVAALFQTAGWGRPAFETWRQQIQTLPVESARPETGFGWTLEAGGRAVGFLRNVLHGYRYGDRDLIAASASTLIVEPDFRGYTLRLVAAFCQQRGIDLLLNTTAAPETATIFQFLKFSRMPQAEYDISLFWILRARGFLEPALRKKGVPGPAITAGSVALAPALSAFLRATGRRIAGGDTACDVRVIDAAQIDERFDDLWSRKLQEGKRLLARRDARTLRWHFPPSQAAHPPRVLCAFKENRLLGYLVLVRRDTASIGLRRARVGDIFVERDDPGVIRRLMAEAAAQAAADGAVMLEVVGMPRAIREPLREFRPQQLPDRCWPFSYKTNDAELRADLGHEEHWYAGPYDGDGTL